MHTRARSCAVMIWCALLAGVGCERGQAANSTGEARAAPPAAAPAVAAAPAPAPAVAAAVGKPAPDFTLTDTEGQRHQLSQLRGKTVVLEWFNPDCPFVKHAHGKGPLVDMAKKYQGPALVWL